jgi:rare lipoprotein A (peptidoglycan hydrolase)
MALLAVLAVGCGASGSPTRDPARTAALPQAHPHAIQPVAGQSASISPGPPPAAGVIPSKDPKVTGPASNTSSVAKGAPTVGEVRAAYAKFQIAVSTYHLDQLNFSGVLLNPAQLGPGQFNVSVASVFTDYGLPIACGGVLHVPQLGVANKTLPCGTMVTFVYNGRAIRVPVLDRGPYIAGREWDLTGATAEALKFPGLGEIYWRIG